MTVEGGRDSSTNYAIDGVYVRSLRFNNLSLNPPLDAIQEVSLLRNSFSTEYGQGQAVVSIVTKSGTNRFTARPTSSSATTGSTRRTTLRRPRRRTSATSSASPLAGRSLRNSVFVFGGYEGLRDTQGRTFLATRAEPSFLRGDFSSLATPIVDPLTGLQFPGNLIPASRFSRFAQILAPTVPAPNNAGANNYRMVRDFVDDADTATIRADQVLAPTTTCSSASCTTTGARSTRACSPTPICRRRDESRPR